MMDMELEMIEAEVRYKKLKLERAKMVSSWQWVQQDNSKAALDSSLLRKVHQDRDNAEKDQSCELERMMFDQRSGRVEDGTSCSTAPVEAGKLVKAAHEGETLASAWTDALTSLAEDVTSMPLVETDGPSKLVNFDLFYESQMSGALVCGLQCQAYNGGESGASTELTSMKISVFPG
jgi:hypothetical protein